MKLNWIIGIVQLHSEFLLCLEVEIDLNCFNPLRIKAISNDFSLSNFSFPVAIDAEEHNECISLGATVKVWQFLCFEIETDSLFEIHHVVLANISFKHVIVDCVGCLSYSLLPQ